MAGVNDPRIRLSDLQLDVMRVLWRADASVAEVVHALLSTRALAHTTIATVLSRLERAGVVSSIRDGRLLRYHARLTETAVRQAMVSDLVDSVFQGDADALLAHVVDGQRISRNVAPACPIEESADRETPRHVRAGRQG